MKRTWFNLIGVILLLISWNVKSQEVGSWKTYLSYQNATIVAETSNLIFAVYDGSLMSYSPDDQEIMTYSVQDGLNDVNIKLMAYSQEAGALILVYENANIDIFMGRQNVFNLADIKDKNIPDKTVHDIFLDGNLAYISGAFGVSVVDLSRKEVKITYNTGSDTKAFCPWGDYYYVATSAGLKRGLIQDNLQDPTNWESFPLTGYPDLEKVINKLCVFKDNLLIGETGRWPVYYINKQGEVRDLRDAIYYWFTGLLVDIKVLKDQLVILTREKIVFLNDYRGRDAVELDLVAQDIACNNSKGNYWLAKGTEGLFGIKKEVDSADYTVTASDLLIDSPISNLCFSMTFEANKLLVVGGGRSDNRFNNQGFLYVYENGKWTNFDSKKIAQQTGVKCADFMSVTVDPRDANRYFVASWGEGVYEFKDNEFVNLYTYKNSTLGTIYPNGQADNYMRVDGVVFDKNNNLYVNNGGNVPYSLSIMSPNGTWKGFAYSPLAKTFLNQMIVDKNNYIWGNVYRSGTGVYVLKNPASGNNTYYYNNSFFDQLGTNIQATAYLSLAEDKDGRVWVGTDNGPISFSNAENVGAGLCNRIVLEDQYGKGYYLLEGQKITAVAIDGANRKWFGTSGSGVYMVDNSGETTTIANYDTSNSFILSDVITDIAIDNSTGEIFIGTDKGLCSLVGTAVEGKPDYSEVYAFPNPVYTSRNDFVTITGLMSDSRVKITDMAGNLMAEGMSLGGQCTLSCRDASGSLLKAGIYLVFASNSDGSEGVVTKFVVIN